MDAGDREIDQKGAPLQGDLKGEYDSNAIHFFAVNLIWKLKKIGKFTNVFYLIILAMLVFTIGSAVTFTRIMIAFTQY